MKKFGVIQELGGVSKVLEDMSKDDLWGRPDRERECHSPHNLNSHQ